MELHIQQCQNCQSRELRNVLVRETNDVVYVQCIACESLVARYILDNTDGYFHLGKGYESYLRAQERGGMSLSTRNMVDEFQNKEEKILEEFDEVKEELRRKYDWFPPK